ncbi:unnamed protein product [Darwinula stevensoni]|uniref:Uncharacterized protein n=1 Tax=Darwinula stevensoni TaxID=69355 RepID=A0A7R9AGT4_9CRUS|nr:unnamed protein product [Darwinula stevensoni]CAG0904420.1 unnamed protein product [Darwinula stevensoni]
MKDILSKGDGVLHLEDVLDIWTEYAVHEVTVHEVTVHEVTVHEVTVHEVTVHEVTVHEVTVHEDILMHLLPDIRIA